MCFPAKKFKKIVGTLGYFMLFWEEVGNTLYAFNIMLSTTNCRHAHYPFGLAVNSEMLYWTDLNTQGVHYMNVTTKKSDVVYSDHKHLLAVVVVTEKQQSKSMDTTSLVLVIN